MATKTLSPHPQPLYSFPFPSRFSTNYLHHPWPARVPTPLRPHVAARLSLQQTIVSSSALMDNLQQDPDSMFFLTETAGYSLSSYYTSLGLFVVSVPGLWSLIKRSVKSKVFCLFYWLSFMITTRCCRDFVFLHSQQFCGHRWGETITFEEMTVPRRGQAALLTFCTCISLALVLTITFPDVGNNWLWITVLSSSAGAYYWKRASRKGQIKVNMPVADDRTVSEVVVQDDQQVDQVRKELKLGEKGMVYVKGLFER